MDHVTSMTAAVDCVGPEREYGSGRSGNREEVGSIR